MKKILLISDTHALLDQALIKHIQQADEVWHAGDLGSDALCDQIEKLKPFKAVYGNIDGASLRQRYPEVLHFHCENVSVLMIHIGGYPEHYPAKIKALLQDKQPQLFICGHSHILKVIYDNALNLLHMNPGACGSQGFHQKKTALRFEIEGKEIKNLAIIELGARTSLTL